MQTKERLDPALKSLGGAHSALLGAETGARVPRRSAEGEMGVRIFQRK